MVDCRSLCLKLVGLIVGVLFEYDTPKFVHIKSKKVGVINRLVQLGIVGYIIGYVDCVTTGNCSDNGICLIRGWCPTEAENDTITRNIPETTNRTFLKHCTFDPNTEDGLFCPIFSLKQIVDMTGDDYDTLATEGAVVGLVINWDCNLDVSSEHCKPEYSARRLDNPVAQISPGYNFRYPKYYYENGIQRRDVWKVYGIKFVVQVTGQATTVTDVFALYILQKAPLYRKKKYQQVETPKRRQQWKQS
ncbi:P2X purinoceptor 4-like [Gigantopelta aegis]|uniref:P2X purinoceptor 4-like n=1 Tax=Gigantopelta aegis TaxID=1735272 RepID=UPI001B88DCFB|nr:P2X purinoceptor 4-like [Gigantopelta aegis]